MKASLLTFLHSRRYTLSLVTVALLTGALLFGLRLRAQGQDSYHASSAPGKYYDKHYDWQGGDYPPGTVKGEAVREGGSGIALNRRPGLISTPGTFSNQ